ncbi:MAG: hypothetical protein RLZZ623_1998 [Actinomycetota bacterium]
MPYQPALDGLRAVAVALVLVFHGGFAWMRGGYVGVSVFFTLSGYLITLLLLAEYDRTGTISLGRFYARRFKRLLPASLICLSAVTLGGVTGVFENVSSLRRDLLGALFQVANWVKLFGNGSYADLTNATLGRVAPLEHYWSLAIEEQFYWVWPLVMLLLLSRVRSADGRLRWLLGMAAVAAIAAPVIAHVWGPDAAYWATPARAGEILVGAALAAVLRRYRVRPRWAGPATLIGLLAIGWAATTWSASSGPAYSGWLPVFALATAAVIIGVQHESLLRRGLSAAPMVWVGSISYGLYLYHWPIFAALTERRLGAGGVALFAARLALTFGAAMLSARFVERPVRKWSPSPARPLVAAFGATALLAVGVLVLVEPSVSAAVDVTSAAIEHVDGTLPELAAVVPSSSTAVVASPTSTSVVPQTTVTLETVTASDPAAVVAAVPVPTPSRPVRVIVIGDSTAEALAVGMVSWAVDHTDVMQVSVAATPGCGFIRHGDIPTDGAIDFAGTCNDVLDTVLPSMVHDLSPDVALLMVTMRDVEDRIWDDHEGALSPFDSRFRSRLLDAYRAMADGLLASGVHRLVWVLAPNPSAAFQGDQRKMSDPARYQVQFDVIAELAAERPDLISVLDLHRWMADQDLLADSTIRPDGLHLSPESARWVTEQFVAGSVVAAALR